MSIVTDLAVIAQNAANSITVANATGLTTSDQVYIDGDPSSPHSITDIVGDLLSLATDLVLPGLATWGGRIGQIIQIATGGSGWTVGNWIFNTCVEDLLGTESTPGPDSQLVAVGATDTLTFEPPDIPEASGNWYVYGRQAGQTIDEAIPLGIAHRDERLVVTGPGSGSGVPPSTDLRVAALPDGMAVTIAQLGDVILGAHIEVMDVSGNIGRSLAWMRCEIDATMGDLATAATAMSTAYQAVTNGSVVAVTWSLRNAVASPVGAVNQQYATNTDRAVLKIWCALGLDGTPYSGEATVSVHAPIDVISGSLFEQDHETVDPDSVLVQDFLDFLSSPVMDGDRTIGWWCDEDGNLQNALKSGKRVHHLPKHPRS